jgi:hypothetical protein
MSNCFRVISVYTIIIANLPILQAMDMHDTAKNITIGSLTGIAEVTVNQPLVYVKNALQQGNRLVPQHCYRGYSVNAASSAPITAVQVAANGILQKVFARDKQQLSDAQKTAASFGAGALSALISSPCELLMMHQQTTGKSIEHTVRQLLESRGITGFTRGLVPTALRDGGFTIGYLSLAKKIQQQLLTRMDSKTCAALAAGVVSGLLAGVVTHPCDTVKTHMQSNNTTVLQAMQELYKSSGLKSFYRGISPRTIRIALAVTLMSTLSQKLDTLL